MALPIQKILYFIWPIISMVVVAYLCLIAIAYFMQARLIYFPDKHIISSPHDIGLDYETINFASSDGINLSGWFVPNDSSKYVILFCHGNAGNISHRLESIKIFHKLGLSVFIFDYRGFGQSDGTPSEKGTYFDGEAAWDYLVQKKKFSADQIIIFGRSLGSSIATWLAQTKSPKALIIESAFTSTGDVAAKHYAFLPVKLLLKFEYNTLAYIKNVVCPVLVIHSPNDEIIPFDHGQMLFQAANNPKQFLEIQGSHSDGFYVSGTKYQHGLKLFLDKYI